MQHFSIDVVEQFMKDLEALLPESIILYFIDHAVRPTNQDPEELSKFLTLTQFIGEEGPKIATVKPRERRRKIKADDVLCELHNKYGAVLISIDYFKDEINSGKIQDLHNLVQFYPVPHWGSQPVFGFEHRRETYGHRTLAELVEKNNSEASRQEALDHVSKFLAKQKPHKKKKEKLAKKIEPLPKLKSLLLDKDDFAQSKDKFLATTPPPSFKPQNLLFVFSISKRKKFVGKKVTLIGRLTDIQEPETPIIWFGSTTPVFITVSDIGGLQPGFVRIVGQLCTREDGTWSLENVESSKNIDERNLKTTISGLSQSAAKNTLKPWGIPPWNRLKLDPDGPRREKELKKLKQAEIDRRKREEASVAEENERKRIATEVQQRERDAFAAEALRLRAIEEAGVAEEQKLRRLRQATSVADERNRLANEEAERIRRERDAVAEEDRAQKRAETLEQKRRDAEKASREKDQSLGESAQEIEDQGVILSQRIRMAQIGLLITGLTVLATALFRIFVG